MGRAILRGTAGGGRLRCAWQVGVEKEDHTQPKSGQSCHGGNAGHGASTSRRRDPMPRLTETLARRAVERAVADRQAEYVEEMQRILVRLVGQV